MLTQLEKAKLLERRRSLGGLEKVYHNKFFHDRYILETKLFSIGSTMDMRKQNLSQITIN